MIGTPPHVLLFLALLALLLPVFGAPLRHMNTTYTKRSYFFRVDTGEGSEQLLLDSAIAYSTFDQDVYLPSECTGNTSFVDIILEPCVNGSMPESLKCIDGASLIANPESCTEIAIRAESIFGDPDITLFTGTPDDRLSFNETADKFGDDGLRICCSEIREAEPTWDGSVVLVVSATRHSQYKLVVYDSSELIPAKDWWFGISGYWSCEGVNRCTMDQDICQKNVPKDCCNIDFYGLPPAPDSLFVNLMNIYGNASHDYTLRGNMIVTEIQARYQGSKLLDCQTVDMRILPTCSIEYVNLVNMDGDRINPKRDVMSEAQLSCDPTDFAEARKGFDKVVERLTSARNTTFLDVDDLLYEGLAWTNSDAYVACENSATSLLKPSPVKSTVNATVCPHDYWTQKEAYLKDPCCNRIAALTECCTIDAREYSFFAFEPDASSVETLCANSKCLMPAAQELANLVSIESSPTEADGCREARLKALRDPRFTSIAAYQYCVGNVYALTCDGGPSLCIDVFGPESYCTGLQSCAVPCTASTDCYGSEYGRQCVDGYCEYYGSKGDSSDEEGLVKCLTDRLDPYISIYIKELVEAANTANIPYSSKFYLATTVEGCSTAKYSTKEACEATQYCNWADCDIGSIVNEGTAYEATCTRELCEKRHFGGDKFCSFCTDNRNCAEWSQFPACVILNAAYASNQSLCEATGHSWNPLEQNGASYTCAKLDVDLAQCMDPSYCNVNVTAVQANYICGALCHIPSVTTKEACDSYAASASWTALDFTYFLEWERDGQTFGVCGAFDPDGYSLDLVNCEQSGEGVYFPSRAFITPFFDTMETCDGFCKLTDYLLGVNKAECLSTGWCTGNCAEGGTCETQTNCRRWGGSCNDWAGCLFPHEQLNDTCKLSQCVDGGWTPDGCLVSSVDNTTCSAKNGTYMVKAQTRYECETKVAEHCVDPTVPATFRQAITTSLTNSPSGYSPLAARECSACGRELLPYFTWTPAKWRATGEWYAFAWLDRTVTRPYKWERVFNFAKFSQLYDGARAKRYANIVKNELVCSYGYNFDAIQSLACSCADDKSCMGNGESASSIRTVVLGTATLCAGVAGNVSLSDVHFEVPADLVFASGSLCADVIVSRIDEGQFESRKEVSLSAASIKSAQSQASITSTVKNSNGIVVGRWIGDGVQWGINDEATASPVQVCMAVTAPEQGEDEIPFKFFDLVAAEENFTKFTPRGLSIPLSNKGLLCVDLGRDSPPFFPAALIDGWETATFTSTWTSAEFGFLIFAVVAYAIAFLVSASVLGLYGYRAVKTHQNGKPVRDLPLIALGLLAGFILIRVIYVSLAFNGSLDGSPAVDTIFSELPTLLFLSVCLVITLRWAEIYHYSMKGAKQHPIRKVVVPLNVIIYLIFAVIIILYFVLPAKQAVDCTTPDSVANTTSAAAIVAYLYKALIAAISLATAGAVAFYGISIYKRLEKHAPANKQESKSPIRRLLIASITCCFFQIAQVANLISSAIVTDRSALSVIITTLLLELFGAALILFLFGPSSIFTKGNNNSRASTALTGSRTPSRPSTNIHDPIPPPPASFSRSGYIEMDSLTPDRKLSIL